MQAAARLMELREEVAKLEERLKAEDIGDDEAADIGNELAPMYEELEDEGNSTAEARAARILHGLGFTEAMRKRTTKSFSGGWRMRISLARALFIQPTLLMLDEPTNHLDLRAVLWLEEYLTRCAPGVYFPPRTCLSPQLKVFDIGSARLSWGDEIPRECCSG